jgi:hypothetical protein
MNRLIGMWNGIVLGSGSISYSKKVYFWRSQIIRTGETARQEGGFISARVNNQTMRVADDQIL